MKKKISEMESQFKEHRLTPQRRLVLEIFLENKERHLSAEEVFQLSREKGEEIGLATIYRTLELLEALGLLRKMNFGDGRSRYELVQLDLTEHHHHHHLVCLSCSRIFEVEEDFLHQLEEIIEQKHHFSIVNHNLQFFGYCKYCRQDV
ncbi:MAG: transcriptional repressor [Dethiobacter sp.]|jgi:Fur family ferric uptake transcriptional regulator|nr:MAG: transcriptional repressor [Dethiobacter sp.]